MLNNRRQQQNNNANFSSVAPSSGELQACKETQSNTRFLAKNGTNRFWPKRILSKRASQGEQNEQISAP